MAPASFPIGTSFREYIGPVNAVHIVFGAVLRKQRAFPFVRASAPSVRRHVVSAATISKLLCQTNYTKKPGESNADQQGFHWQSHKSFTCIGRTFVDIITGIFSNITLL